MEIKWHSPITYGGKGGYDYPDEVGVYVIAKKEGNGLVALYVGQGVISERMADHESKNEQNDCLRNIMQSRDKSTTVYHGEVINGDDRDNAEYTIWYNYEGHLGKLCNDKTPPGKTDFSVKFPFDKIQSNY